jgi:hypothetical protein
MHHMHHTEPSRAMHLTRPPARLSICPLIPTFCPPAYLLVSTLAYLPPARPPTSSPAHSPICPSARPLTCPPAHLLTCPPVHLLTHPPTPPTRSLPTTPSSLISNTPICMCLGVGAGAVGIPPCLAWENRPCWWLRGYGPPLVRTTHRSYLPAPYTSSTLSHKCQSSR